MKKGLILVAVLAVTLGITTAASGRVQALITGAQIKDGSVESQDMEDRTILPKDLSKRAVAALRGNRGPRGFAGARGAAGRDRTGTGRQAPSEQGATGARRDRLDRSDRSAGRQGRPRRRGARHGPRRDGRRTARVRSGRRGRVHRRRRPAISMSGTARRGSTRVPFRVQGIQGPGYAGRSRGPGHRARRSRGAHGADGGLAGYEIVTGTPVAITGSDFNVAVIRATAPSARLRSAAASQSRIRHWAVVMVDSRPTALGAGWAATMFNLE